MAERRRLIIIIVEGKSEENALSSLMKCLFSPDEVIFHIMNGDMMTKNQKNITRIVESIVGEESRRYGLQRSDIKAVIVTSPSYEGIVSDIREIKEICTKYASQTAKYVV